MHAYVAVMFCLLFGGCLVGCATLNPQPPIEAFANKLADEAIIPAVRQGIQQGIEHLSVQAGAQGIDPTYVVRFEGKWVVGIEGRASIGVEGVAGQLQISGGAVPAGGVVPAAGDGPSPGGIIDVTIDDVDSDSDLGFARLPDGTLVSVFGASTRQGQAVSATVTRVTRTMTGRLIEAVLRP